MSATGQNGSSSSDGIGPRPDESVVSPFDQVVDQGDGTGETPPVISTSSSPPPPSVAGQTGARLTWSEMYQNLNAPRQGAGFQGARNTVPSDSIFGTAATGSVFGGGSVGQTLFTQNQLNEPTQHQQQQQQWQQC